ncbi:OmpA family protein [Paraburkholderia nodosa]|uniref:OmpA family protein n=1 Tax=Paraburkholderia nodosa TaxID=392320 RepID=UPI000480E0DF|nr:OmpA family protein [Paraburkholderia nodosa]
MSINVFQLLDTVLSENVFKTMGTRYGLTPEFTRKVAGAAAPAIMAAIMNRGATPEGARSLFSTIMSSDTNPLIGKQLPELLASTADLGQLEATGRELLQKATGANVGALADAVAVQTGAPQSMAFSLAGVVGAAIMGILKQHFTASQGFVGQLPTLLGHQLPAVNASLTDHLASAVGLGSAAAFAGSIMGRLKDVSARLDHPQPVVRPVPASVPPQTVAESTPPIAGEKRRHHWLWWLLAALALIVAFFALRSCQHNEVDPQDAAQPATANSIAPGAVAASDAASQADSASAPVTASATAASVAVAAVAASDAVPAPTQDSHLSFTVDKSGMPTITATVGTEAEKTQLIDALTKQFGAGKFTANVNVDAATKPAEWLAHLDGLLPLMALPGAQVKIDGTHVELSGAAADTKAGWLDKLKALFGSGFDIGVFNVQKAVTDATQSFRDAVKGLFAADSSCAGADVAKVLNLQVMNFRTGSSVVPASAADDLRQSARALIACAKRGQPVSLEVAGYSDNVGDKAANLALSKQRALAVRTYLASQGVPLSRLAAQGYGDANPVDSNDTESGRFHNRRIEFVAK